VGPSGGEEKSIPALAGNRTPVVQPVARHYNERATVSFIL
jgi:hypothetical protein